MEKLLDRQMELGAEVAETAAGPVALSFGDTAREYEAIRTTAGVAVRSDLAQLRMFGRDPVRMLQGLITNDLVGASMDRAVYAAMLTPKGRMITDLRAFFMEGDGAREVLVDLPREALPAATDHLKRYVPPMFAKWELLDRMEVLGIYGPLAVDLASETLGARLDDMPEDRVHRLSYSGQTVLAVGSAYTGSAGVELFAPADAAGPLLKSLERATADKGGTFVGWNALEIARVEAGRPRFGAELTAETIPTEAYETTGMLQRAISFTKGCYTGQEVVVRIAHRGHVNRHVRALRCGGAAPPEPGTRLFHPESGKDVGWVTSSVHSPGSGETLALGYVRREIEPGGEVRIGTPEGSAAEVVNP